MLQKVEIDLQKAKGWKVYPNHTEIPFEEAEQSQIEPVILAVLKEQFTGKK